MIDWARHFGRIEAEIAAARRRVRRGHFRDLPPRWRRESEAQWIAILAAMLKSKHIPAVARAETPDIPWRAISRLADYIELCRRHRWEVPPSVLDDFNTRAALRLVPALRALKEQLAMANADGNDGSGILSRGDPRGGFTHVTLRVPVEAIPALQAWVARIYEGRPAPTLEDVRARLAAASARLRDLGVTEVAVFGSVAKGHAAPASDVDLVYRTSARLDFSRWADLCELFEAVLERVVDAHAARPEDASPAGAVVVWRAES